MELQDKYIFDWKRIFFEDNFHVEYSITDICNRNCRACSHLAPLAKRPNFVNIEEFTRVVKIVRKCLPDIHTFWLTGGEPTLHPEFMQLLQIARETFNGSYIGIYTNGKSLPTYESDERIWSFTKENGIVWGLTVYENSRQYYEDLFTKHGCGKNLAFVRGGNRFTNLINYAYNQPMDNKKYERCGWERCKINIRKGRIFNCASSEFCDLFNGYFGTNLILSPEDSLLIDETLTRERIYNFKQAIPFCKQCDIEQRNTRLFPNEPSKRAIEEWSNIKK